MDALGAAQALISTVNYLKGAVDKVRENKEQCKTLYSYVCMLCDLVQSESGKDLPPSLCSRLSKLTDTLHGLAVVIEDLSQSSSLKRIIWRNTVSSRIKNAHKEVQQALQMFNLGANIELRRYQHDTEEARRADNKEAEDKFERLFRENKDIFNELQINRQQMPEATLCLLRYLQNRLPPSERKVLEDGLHVIRRRSGQLVTLPDDSIITSIDLVIYHERKLGHGGFASVYEADWKGMKVAVKLMNPGTPSSAVQQEIEIWKLLRHPHIVQFYGACPVGSPPFMVCAIKANGDAVSYTAKNPDAYRRKILHDASLGLIYLHDTQVVHGDLKGTNILIDEHGRACLADFGLSKIKIRTATVLTEMKDQQCGAARWMSPEVLTGTEPDMRSDIYSFAMTMYEVFTGTPPFSRTPDGMLLEVICQRGDRPARPHNTSLRKHGLDDSVWSAMTRAWCKDKVQRQTAQELSLSIAAEDDGIPLRCPLPSSQSSSHQEEQVQSITGREVPSSSSPTISPISDSESTGLPGTNKIDGLQTARPQGKALPHAMQLHHDSLSNTNVDTDTSVSTLDLLSSRSAASGKLPQSSPPSLQPRRSRNQAGLNVTLRSAEHTATAKPNRRQVLAQTERLKSLRECMRDKQSDYYVVPNEDAHGSEFIAECDKRMEWITGFTGPVGYAVISQTSAHLIIMPLYDIQARRQISNEWIIRVDRKATSASLARKTWIKLLVALVAKEPGRVGIDARLIPHQTVLDINAQLTSHGRGSRLCFPQNLVDLIWTNRPNRSHAPVYVQLMPRSISIGLEAGAKLGKLRGWIEANAVRTSTPRGTDVAMLISNLSSIAHLLNLRGTEHPLGNVFLSYLFVSITRAVLFIDRAKVTPEVDRYLRILGVECRDYHDVWTFLRRDEGGYSKIIITPETSHGVALMLGKQRCSVLHVAIMNQLKENDRIWELST